MSKNFNLPDIPTNHKELGRFLRSLVLLNRPEIIVELGTWYGYSAICMGQAVKFLHEQFGGSKHNAYRGRVFTVDHYQDCFYSSVFVTLEGYGVSEYVTQIAGYTSSVGHAWANAMVDLLFVDADHTYEGVLFDLRAWIPHMSPGGIIVLVMYPDKGVERALYDIEVSPELYGAWSWIRIPTKIERLEVALMRRE
jgi:predicted O-methyltransferase YrrM